MEKHPLDPHGVIWLPFYKIIGVLGHGKCVVDANGDSLSILEAKRKSGGESEAT